jgi:hypothetical protein
VTESCTICSSRSRRPVLKLLDTPSYSLDWQDEQLWGIGRDAVLSCRGLLQPNIPEFLLENEWNNSTLFFSQRHVDPERWYRTMALQDENYSRNFMTVCSYVGYTFIMYGKLLNQSCRLLVSIFAHSTFRILHPSALLPRSGWWSKGKIEFQVQKECERIRRKTGSFKGAKQREMLRYLIGVRCVSVETLRKPMKPRDFRALRSFKQMAWHSVRSSNAGTFVTVKQRTERRYINRRKFVPRFEAYMAMMVQVDVFWVVPPCSVVVGGQRFGGPCCLHLQGEASNHFPYPSLRFCCM